MIIFYWGISVRALFYYRKTHGIGISELNTFNPRKTNKYIFQIVDQINGFRGTVVNREFTWRVTSNYAFSVFYDKIQKFTGSQVHSTGSQHKFTVQVYF